MTVTCKDGKTFEAPKVRLIGSLGYATSNINSKDIHRPAVIGEYPVFVRKSGSLFVYTSKIESTEE